MQLEPDEVVHVMTLGEAIDHVVPMLPDACRQIGSDADVQRAVAMAGEEIDAGISFLHAVNPFTQLTCPEIYP